MKCQEDLEPALQWPCQICNNWSIDTTRRERKLMQIWQNVNIFWEIWLKGIWEFLVLFPKSFSKYKIISKGKVKQM